MQDTSQLVENVLMKRLCNENKESINTRQISPLTGEKKKRFPENKTRQNAYLKRREQIFNITEY